MASAAGSPETTSLPDYPAAFLSANATLLVYLARTTLHWDNAIGRLVKRIEGLSILLSG